MNLYEMDILNAIGKEPFVSQRHLAEITGHSIGIVNRSIKSLKQEGFINDSYSLMPKADEVFERKAPKQAVILAAGFGMRMVPINTEIHKAFLEVKGEILIERLIEQLHEVGIRQVTIVVGFMKELFEYLIDKYGVNLIFNPDYAKKNNLHSLYLAKDYLDNAYILPCDNWAAENPFNKHELYSWYMISDEMDPYSPVRINRKNELVFVNGTQPGNTMMDFAYILEEDAQILRDRLAAMDSDIKYDGSFWETALYEKGKMGLWAKQIHAGDIVEINTYEELRNLDCDSNQLKTDAIQVIAKTFSVTPNDVKDITILKKGMTNRSFLFSCRGKKYIMRIPGEGTDQLINRQEEAAVFRSISGLGFCDDPVYINPENGYKITAFLENVRVCEIDDVDDLKRVMKKLKAFHDMNLQVSHRFDIFEKIAFYESLWQGEQSIYRDYETTKINVMSLRAFIDAQPKQDCLTHIDAVPDNFLFYSEGDGEALQLTDWEYAAMQDPHVDIAMFCIYSMYNKEQVDRLIDIYFEGNCDGNTVTKIYCYIACCGLLWSNWCEYKRQLGVEFGEYSLAQFRYAKEYYRIAKARIELIKGEKENATN